jgi:DNA-binding MarR family transcriptional regulator
VTTQPANGPEGEQIAWALHRLAAAWATDDVLLARTLNVTSGDLLALKHVAVTDGIGPAELSRRLGMSTGSVNALINRLVAGGHLHRQRHPHDARRLTLCLDDGIRDRIANQYRARTDRVLGSVSLRGDQWAVILHFLTNPAWFTPLAYPTPNDPRQ